MTTPLKAAVEIGQHKLPPIQLTGHCATCGEIFTFTHRGQKYCSHACYGESKRVADVSPLLDETPTAYYRMGFLLADGSFGKDRTLSVSSAEKDGEHIEMFRQFIRAKSVRIHQGKPSGLLFGYANNGTKQPTHTVCAWDINMVPHITSKFGILERKTYNPPMPYTWLTDDLLLTSLIVGLIDGDGAILYDRRTGPRVSIQVHRSWMGFYEHLNKRLSGIAAVEYLTGEINKRAMYIVSWRKHALVSHLKKVAIAEQLPILTRKWDRIDLDRILDTDRAVEYSRQILPLRADGMSYQDIANHLGIGVGRTKQVWCASKEYHDNASVRPTYSSKYKGVYWNKKNAKWMAGIGYQNKSYHLGYFDNEEEAHQAYRGAALLYFGERATFEKKHPGT